MKIYAIKDKYDGLLSLYQIGMSEELIKKYGFELFHKTSSMIFFKTDKEIDSNFLNELKKYNCELKK